MRILIGSSDTFYFHFQEFCKELRKLNIDYKLIHDNAIYPFTSNFRWFRIDKEYSKIIKDFRPDIVLVDTQTKFGLAAIKSKIPLFILLRGNYWEEMKSSKKILSSMPQKQLAYQLMAKIGKSCLDDCKAIFPVCKYLENIVKEHYPDKPTQVIHVGVNSDNWYPEEGMKLKHPCIGLVQTANIWEKTKGMLFLPKIMKALPDVTFYWAGDGQYKEKVLPVLEQNNNFKWLGKLEYPKKIRQFLTEIDIYALISGLDMTPVSLLEAQMMGKPIVATNVGGISETMMNRTTGILIKERDIQDWIEKIRLLLTEKEVSREMRNEGPLFVKKNFNWESAVKIFLKKCEEVLH